MKIDREHKFSYLREGDSAQSESVLNKSISRRHFSIGGIAAAAATLFGGGFSTSLLANQISSGLSKIAPAQAFCGQIPLRVYGDDNHMVWYRRAEQPETPRARYPGFKQETVLLKKGQIRREGAKPLLCDIYLDRDVAVKLRDGTTIYTDVFRPAVAGKYPAIIAWSPYGKEVGNQHLDDIPNRSGVPLSSLSELQKWEANDPAEWVNNGYVILQPDTRGSFSSEGNIPFWGRQLAEDGYDFIEWGAEQEWSNGKLGMSGNSWLTVSQWFIAAECPPHLKAIAPWEGFNDVLREQAMRGGIPQLGFNESFIELLPGNNYVEDTVKMSDVERNDTLYWKDKAARLERINIPAYVVASYENSLHTHGSFEGFRRIRSKDKWLRVHNNHEWFDLYQKDSQRELTQFFDYYLKGEENGWKETPQVRISVLDPGHQDTINQVVDAWPPKGFNNKKLYLHANNSLSIGKSSQAKLNYDATDGKAVFRIQFNDDAEIVGYMKALLWVEAVGSNDIDLTVTVEKLDRDGNPVKRALPQGGMGLTQAYQYQRASRRTLDLNKSTESEPYLLLQDEKLLHPGEIVPLDIAIWPMGLRVHKGEYLQLTVSPFKSDNNPPPFGAARIPVPADKYTFEAGENVKIHVLGDPKLLAPEWVTAQAPKDEVRNKGQHVIHMGSQHDSHLLIPYKLV